MRGYFLVTFFFSGVDVWFGGLRDVVCSDVDNTQDLDIKSVLTQQVRGQFIITAVVFFWGMHSTSTNKAGETFLLHARSSALVRIHLLLDVLRNKN